MDFQKWAKEAAELRTVDAKTYWHVFKNDPAGEQILEELTALFYDIKAFDANPYITAHNEGKRAVIMYILMKLTNSQMPEETDESN
jgi:hypothetical protein